MPLLKLAKTAVVNIDMYLGMTHFKIKLITNISMLKTTKYI
jgi:hypothetical protein